ncbi:hypothetical protein LZB33_09175, partial [Campylobacter jejuni]|nr:hypothetical protein [Campylobacter jejuni]
IAATMNTAAMMLGLAHDIVTWPLTVITTTSIARIAIAMATPIQTSLPGPRKPRQLMGRCSTNRIHAHNTSQTPAKDASNKIVEV